MASSDGSIILKTAVDTSGLSKGLKGISGVAKTTAKGILAIAGAVTAVTTLGVKAYAEFEQLAGGAELMFGKASETVMKNAREAYATVQMSQNEYLKQVNGFAVGLKTSLGGNEQAAADLAHRIVVAEADIVAATGETQENIQNAFNGIMKNNFTMLDNLKLGITPTKEGYQEIIDKVNAWNAANGKATNYQMGNLADMQSALVDYVKMQGLAGYASREAADTIQGSTAMMKASWENLLIAMSTGEGIDDAVNAFVYSLERVVANMSPVIERVLIGLGQSVSIALPSLVQMVVNALMQQIPMLVLATYNMIVGLIQGIIRGIKTLFTGGTKKITSEIKNNLSSGSSSADDMADGMSKTAEATKKAGKEAKKSLAAFDDLNILSSSATSGTDKASSGQVSTPSMGTSGGGGEGTSGITQKISTELQAIMGVAGAALLAIGLLLLFTGNIVWGIGFVIAGAAAFGVALQSLSNEDSTGVISEKLMTILAIAGTALVAIGLILLFGGTWQWGIAFLIAGAGALGVAIVATQNGKVEKDSQEMLLNIMTAAGGALLALGIILLLCGVVSALSIGLVVAGAASLATAVALKPKEVGKKISDFLKDNDALIIGVSSALLIIGILLCLCGVISPLSIGLIVAGAAGLATEITLNEQATYETIKTFFQDNAGLIVGVSLALLVIGIVLCMCGVVTPLSIGLIVAGAAGLITEIALNWNYIVDKITNFFKENAGLIVGVSLALLVIGIVLCLCGVISPLSIGLIVAGATGLVTEIVINWNAIVDKVTNFFKENSGLIVGVSLALLVLGIVLCLCGVVSPLSIGLIVAGAAGLVTEIVLNWKYITEKVTNFIRDNSGLIVGVSLALLILGIILLFTGVGIPLAIGLIVAGSAGLVTTVALNWNFIVDKVKDVWKKIKDFWNDYIAPVFTAKWWKDLGKTCINGLISGFEAGINGIITMFEKMINWIVDGINKISFDVPDWVPVIGGKKFGFNLKRVKFDRVSIPRLARGAVIPPNKEFFAVLGDQKHGTNIEAPLDTIVEAMNIALAQNGTMGGSTEVVLELDGRALGRAIIEQGDIERRRIGTRLVIA